jgi:glycosyltransferase involved in cell wall biosynthesis
VNLLVLSHKLPYPTSSGAAVVLRGLLRELAPRHSVHLLSLYGGEAELAALPELQDLCADVEVFRQRGRWGPTVLADLARGRSLHVARHGSPELAAAARRLLDREQVDLVQVETFYMAQHLPPKRPPVVLDMHNVTWLLMERVAATVRGPARPAAAVEARRVRREEIAACRGARVSVTLSEADRRVLLEAAPDLEAEVVTPGVDTQELRPPARPAETAELVYVGHMRYRPNVDAAVFFCEEVLPLVARQVPEVRLTIVGDPAPAVRRLARDPRVRLAGSQVEVAPFVHAAAVSIVPLRFAGGVRLKILEAMALGSAIVSTGIGAEGLGLADGEELLLADRPEEFAAATIRLLEHPGLRAELGRRARRAAVERFSWSRSARALERVYEKALARPPAGGRAGPRTRPKGRS